MDDEVEVLAVVDEDLDVPLEDGRGVASAGSVRADRAPTARCVTAPVGRGSVRPAPARQEPVGEKQQAIERIRV